MEDTNDLVDSTDEIKWNHHRTTLSDLFQGTDYWEKCNRRKGAEDNNIVDDWEDKDMLRRSWISGTLREEIMYLTVGYSTAKEMWECLGETYIQATEDKKFEIK